MRMVKVLLASAALVASAVSSYAAPHVFKDAGVEIPVPDGWKADEKDGVVTVKAGDSAMAVVFGTLPGDVSDKTLEEIDKKIQAGTGKIDWEDKPEKEKVNGMDAEFWEGTAKEGKLQVEAAYIDLPNEKVLTYYWFDTPESEKKYEKQIDEIMKGLKPVK